MFFLEWFWLKGYHHLSNQWFSPRTHLEVDGITKFDVQEASLSPLLEVESLFNHVDHDHVMFFVGGLIPILYNSIESNLHSMIIGIPSHV